MTIKDTYIKLMDGREILLSDLVKDSPSIKIVKTEARAEIEITNLSQTGENRCKTTPSEN